MNTKKTFYSITFSLFICFVFCFSLFGCKKYDDIMFDFYQDTNNGEYNAITIDLGESNSGIYFIEEKYGIWSHGNEKHLFDFDYVPRTQGGGQLMINIATNLSYSQSIVERGDEFACFYYGKLVFIGSCKFSDDETVATISPENIYVNEMSIDTDHTVTLTKKLVSHENVVPFDDAIRDMGYVSPDYSIFLSNQDGVKFTCELAGFWIDASTKIGEWSTNGSTIPIRMKLHEKIPYVEIYDISGTSEKLILKSYANVIDDTMIELVSPKGEMFYITPSAPVTIKKTN